MDETSNRLPPTSMSAYIAEKMKENEEFLLSNTRDTIREVVDLVSDAIDKIGTH